MDTISDVAKLASPQSSGADAGMTSPHAETTSDKNKQLLQTVSQSPKASTATRVQESIGMKHPTQPSLPVNRYKLDNRPVAFRIVPPLPAGLADVSILCVFLSVLDGNENFALTHFVYALIFNTVS